MKINELVWKDQDVVYEWHHHERFRIYRAKQDTHYARAGNYCIAKPPTNEDYWRDLDVIAAQAIIYHLLGEVTP
jgi:hypothetical protein